MFSPSRRTGYTTDSLNRALASGGVGRDAGGSRAFAAAAAPPRQAAGRDGGALQGAAGCGAWAAVTGIDSPMFYWAKLGNDSNEAIANDSHDSDCRNDGDCNEDGNHNDLG